MTTKAAGMKRKAKSVKAWGGFVEGKLHVTPTIGNHKYDEPRYAVFPSPGDALRAYEDVRSVEIRELPKRKRQ